ncbi:MAG: hypothetical protein M3498_10380 [Deinococcota bacterium]|nr:hypothetical protein [Deinococcota bacterium]
MLFVFLDGVGLGAEESAHNPLVAAETPFLDGLLGGRLTLARGSLSEEKLLFRPLDARLGVPGLPQSATGQTALLSGHNAAALMNRHYGPYPGPTLKAVLEAGTLFSELRGAGKTSALANAYPEGFFEAVRRGQRRLNVPVYSALAAGLALKTAEDYLAGEGTSADLTGSYLHALEPRLPERGPEEAGALLGAFAQGQPFTFFDFWLSDAAGHRWPFAEAVSLVERLDAFFAGLVPALNGTTLVLSSDHGNIEDKRVKTHTLNPVPLLVLGAVAAFTGAASLVDVAPAVRRTLGLKPQLLEAQPLETQHQEGLVPGARDEKQQR